MNRNLMQQLRIGAAALAGALALAVVPYLHAQSSEPWTTKDVLQPAALAKMLKGPGEKPLILQVGFESLYDASHIPDASYCGPARSADGIERLKDCLAKAPKARAIVLYCGCCPWKECPNIRAAYRAATAMGFRNVKVLYLADTFGHDWVDLGYPTARK